MMATQTETAVESAWLEAYLDGFADGIDLKTVMRPTTCGVSIRSRGTREQSLSGPALAAEPQQGACH